MSIRKRKDGRYLVSVENARRGIKRTRRIFPNEHQAREWQAALLAQAHDALIGRRRPRRFGEALNRYLAEISPVLKSHTDNLAAAQSLRWPIWTEGHWVRLEDVPLEAPPGQLHIINAMAAWRADLQQIRQRAYLGHQIYQLRQAAEGSAWYRQDDGAPPPPRVRVTDTATLAKLEDTEGRGPYSSQTLRTRQALVKAVLRCCWQQWDWLSREIGSKITLEKPAPARHTYLNKDQLARLSAAALASEYGIHLAQAIQAACWIGWRRANVLGLRWEHVVFPSQDQIGYILAPAEETKAGQPLAQPMSRALLGLLSERQAHANGPWVFHRGDGREFGDFRRTWRRIKEAAGIDPALRWHDLRHTWASHLVQAGATDRQLMELGGWSSPAMTKRYAHLRLEHLQHILEKL